MYANTPQIRHSLPTIIVQDSRTGKTVQWKMHQPVMIWSQSVRQWCPGEISHITQDADGYCLDVRYWAKPQLPKAKYLAPLSECLRPIDGPFVCRNEWNSGCKVECFSNSQKRWYKATIVDVIRYPDDKEDWLKIQWSLDISSNSNSHPQTPTSPNSNTPQIMSKEVGRSSIWIRHRYHSLKHQSPPNMQPTVSAATTITTTNGNNHNNEHEEVMIMNNVILPNGPNQAPQSKEMSYTAPEYSSQNAQIRRFEPNESIQESEEINEKTNKNIEMVLNKMKNVKIENEEEQKSMEQIEENSEFIEEFKPNDFTEKHKEMEAMDDDLMAAFCDSSDSSNEDGSESESDEEEESDQNESVRIINSDNENMQESDSEESEADNEDNKKEKPMLVQSDSRMVQSDGHSWDEEKKEMLEKIEELKFRLEMTEQDLNGERETSGPLLKEVELQKIQIAKLQEENGKLSKLNKSDLSLLSPTDQNEENENDESGKEMSAKLAEFKKTLNTPQKSKSKRHQRSLSFTSNSSLHSLTNNGNVSGNDAENENVSKYDGLRAQELIDTIYDRKVTMLTDQIQRMQQDIKRKDLKLSEYKTKDANKKREIQLLEHELNELRRAQTQKQKMTDTQNMTMYRDQVRKLTQDNESLKKMLQTAHDSQKSVELKKQDIQEELRTHKQMTNNIQQNVQRVMQQNNSITSQVEALHAILSHFDSQIGHHRHYNHLDTIRKCNMRAIQILHEMLEKSKRKRSDNYSLNSSMSSSKYGHPHTIQKRKSYKVLSSENMSEHSHSHLFDDVDPNANNHNDNVYRHSTKSTRFSDKKQQRHKQQQMTQQQGQVFDFDNAPIAYSNNHNHNPQSVRSRNNSKRRLSQQNHHSEHVQQQQNMHNMQPLVLKPTSNSKSNNHKNNSRLLMDHSQQKNKKYDIRQKRVSYDYVDGHQQQQQHVQHKYHQKYVVNAQNSPAINEYEEDEYSPHHRMSQYDQESMQQQEEGGHFEEYFDKLWTVKYPRRSSKVGLFHSNKGHKTRINIDGNNKYLIFQCDQSNNNLVTKILVADIKNYDISEKKNVSIYTQGGKKYKIKCQKEREAAFWVNLLNSLIAAHL